MPGTNAKSAAKSLETFRAINEALKSANNEQRRLFRVQGGVALQLSTARGDVVASRDRRVISKQLVDLNEKMDRLLQGATTEPLILGLTSG